MQKFKKLMKINVHTVICIVLALAFFTFDFKNWMEIKLFFGHNIYETVTINPFNLVINELTCIYNNQLFNIMDYSKMIITLLVPYNYNIC